MKLFVSFEGVEAVGKSTLIPPIIDSLQAQGVKCAVKREFPESLEMKGKIEGALARSLFISEGFDEGAAAALFFMLYAEAINLKAADQDCDVLIGDRGLDSIAIYQGWFAANRQEYSPDLFLTMMENLYSVVGLPLPDRVFLLSVPHEQINNRFRRRTSRSLSASEKERIVLFQEFFQQLAKARPKYREIDADRNPDLIMNEIVDVILADLKERIQ